MCGIKKNLTTHIGRHTSRQMIGNAGIRDTQVINSIMGWSDGKSMSSLYNEVYDDDLITARNLYNEYLKHNL